MTPAREHLEAADRLILHVHQLADADEAEQRDESLYVRRVEADRDFYRSLSILFSALTLISLLIAAWGNG